MIPGIIASAVRLRVAIPEEPGTLIALFNAGSDIVYQSDGLLFNTGSDISYPSMSAFFNTGSDEAYPAIFVNTDITSSNDSDYNFAMIEFSVDTSSPVRLQPIIGVQIGSTD